MPTLICFLRKFVMSKMRGITLTDEAITHILGVRDRALCATFDSLAVDLRLVTL